MKQIALFSLIFIQLVTQAFAQTQIIADHTIVADYDKIPEYYITEVKKMMVSFPGASHSAAYRSGLNYLEAADPTYQVNIAFEEAYTTSYLRCNDIGRYMQEDEWYTWYAWPEGSRPGESDSIKNIIKRNHDNGHPITAMGFGWCWDMLSSYVSWDRDPVYNVKWWGTSVGGPDAGTLGWGLDAEDYSITSNSVCMDTYLNATLDYIAYCTNNGYSTKIIFTTGPVDFYTGEAAYQAYIKHEYIRNFVREDPTRILFDYADILCYDDDGSMNTESWTYDDVTYTFPFITATNLGDQNTGHIGTAGAIRLAKAIWWMMARIAGWDGVNPAIPVTQITVTGAGGATIITTDDGTLQLSANVLPADATNKTVTWSVINGTGQATISSTGLVTAKANGMVTARATANDGSGVYGEIMIILSNQELSINLSNICDYGLYTIQLPGKIVIRSDNQPLNISQCSVYSIQGKLIHQIKEVVTPMELDISSFPSGICIIKLTWNRLSIPLKVIIP